MKNSLDSKTSLNSHMMCKIEKNEISLTKPFKYFLDTLASLPYSKIILTDCDGITGEGEIVHAIDANGETQGGVIYLEPILNHLLSNYNTVSAVYHITEIMKNLRLNIIHNTGLLCGIEQALFNILGKKTGRNLTETVGITENSEIYIQTTIPMEKTFELYKNRVDEIMKNYNPKFVKFKVGIDLTLESKIIYYLWRINNNISISIDANQAFANYRDALSFLDKISNVNITWAEQLLAKDDIDGMKSLRKTTRVPLMADESLHTPLEAEYFCQNNLVDYFNIKLAKTGGILKALEIIKIAEKYDKKVMLGSMLHGKLGIEYNLGFALSQQFITNDFFSYFNVIETKELGYISPNLSVTNKSLYR